MSHCQCATGRGTEEFCPAGLGFSPAKDHWWHETSALLSCGSWLQARTKQERGSPFALRNFSVESVDSVGSPCSESLRRAAAVHGAYTLLGVVFCLRGAPLKSALSVGATLSAGRESERIPGGCIRLCADVSRTFKVWASTLEFSMLGMQAAWPQYTPSKYAALSQELTSINSKI